MDCERGRILEPNEAYTYYTTPEGEHRCLYTYQTKDGRPLNFEAEKLFDCLIQRDELLRKTGLDAQERLEIHGRPDGGQRWRKVARRLRAAIGCMMAIGEQAEQEARRQGCREMEDLATLVVDSCSGLQKMIDRVEETQK